MALIPWTLGGQGVSLTLTYDDSTPANKVVSAAYENTTSLPAQMSITPASTPGATPWVFTLPPNTSLPTTSIPAPQQPSLDDVIVQFGLGPQPTGTKH